MFVQLFKKFIKNEKGFTLMELLVTVILVAVLASYSIYQYNNTIDEGKLNAAKGKLSALGGATARYFLENTGTGITCGKEKKVENTFKSCGKNEGLDKIYDVFACGYAETSLSHEENFTFYFGCPIDKTGCGTYAEYTVFMMPKEGVESDIFPTCAYFNVDTDKIVEMRD